jgi:enoyl-CoA hydratase/carnithine racemase
MTYTTIRYETEEHLARVTLSRPEAGNAVNPQMAAELREVCSQIRQQEGLRGVIIAGDGYMDFCSGEDAVEFTSVPSGELVSMCSLAEVVSQVEIPVIAAINGKASGIGLALALACDLRISSDKATFSVRDNGDGYLLPTGLTQWLPRIVGVGKASEMLLLGDPIDSEEAHRVGLVHRLVSPPQVMAESEKLARSIVAKAPIAMKYAKEAMHKGLDFTLEQGLRLECDLYMILHTTADRHEGIEAFQQKRTPQFKGK